MPSIAATPKSATKPIAAETAERLAQVAELADPFQAVAARQWYTFAHLLLRLEHRAAQIAPAHAELDGDVAALVLAIDERGARFEVHIGELAERQLRDAAARLRRA